MSDHAIGAPPPVPGLDRTPDAGWSRALLAAGALLGLLTVAAGALAAHLPDRLLAPDGRELLRSAVQMQGWHVTALLACGLLADRRRDPVIRAAGLCFAIGILCFAAGVDSLALPGGAAWTRIVARLAPFGGTVLMLGWLLLALAGLRLHRRG